MIRKSQQRVTKVAIITPKLGCESSPLVLESYTKCSLPRQLSKRWETNRAGQEHTLQQCRRRRCNPPPLRYRSNRWWTTITSANTQEDREKSERRQYPLSCSRPLPRNRQGATFCDAGKRVLTCGFSCLNALNALFAKPVVIVEIGGQQKGIGGGQRRNGPGDDKDSSTATTVLLYYGRI